MKHHYIIFSKSLINCCSGTIFRRNYLKCQSEYIRSIMRCSRNCRRIYTILEDCLSEKIGFEWYPFKVGSYNKVIAKREMRLSETDNALAVIILTTPSFFESSFKDWITAEYRNTGNLRKLRIILERQPIKKYMTLKLNEIQKAMLPLKIWWTCDNEPVIHRDPIVSLPLAGHISGAAYFYSPDLCNNSSCGKWMGLSLHAQYGGHFCFRGVLVFPEIELPTDFKEVQPYKTLTTEASIFEALKLINVSHNDNRYRDCGNPVQRYSDFQLKYFSTPDRHRWELLQKWLENSQ